MNEIFRPDLPEDKLIEVTAWVMRHVADNAIAGGSSFRSLIYDRMGFSGAAYKPLYEAGGMALANLEALPEDDAG